MEKITVAVLFGGNSTEYKISLQSACSVIASLDPDKYHVITLGITRQGEWLKYSGSTELIREDTWNQSEFCTPAIISPDRHTRGILVLDKDRVTKIPIDAAFPVLHGKNGEDGTVQGLLEMAGIPCVGCGTFSSALCMDKDAAHRLVQSAGIKVPNSILVYSPTSDEDLLERAGHLSYPLFVKPVNSGSSIGITEVFGPGDLAKAARIAFLHDRKVIIEEAVPGFEVGCAILGNEKLIIGDVDEIELSQGFFDFKEKYTQKTSKIHMPARIEADMADRIRQAALVIYRTLGCTGFARVDMFLTPEKEIVFNEVNTILGLTTLSRFPKMLKGAGMTFPQITDELIKLAVQL